MELGDGFIESRGEPIADKFRIGRFLGDGVFAEFFENPMRDGTKLARIPFLALGLHRLHAAEVFEVIAKRA